MTCSRAFPSLIDATIFVVRGDTEDGPIEFVDDKPECLRIPSSRDSNPVGILSRSFG